MRLCAAPLCDEAATVYFHGAYCGFHALRRFGRVPAELAKIELSRRSTGGMAASSARPLGAETPHGPSPTAHPVTPSVAASAPDLPVLTEDELLDILERESGWVEA